MNKNSLKQRFLGATKWTLLGFALGTVIRLGSSLILTRLLAPDLYGVMSIGYMVVTGLTMISDVGLIAGAIQSRRGDDPSYLNVTWIVAIARGAVIMIATLLLAGALALGLADAFLPAHSVYTDPRIPGLIAAVSLYSFITGFESTKTIIARRALSLERLTKIDLACHAASTAFIIAWAWVSPSVWALAFGWVFFALMKTVLSHVWLPGPPNRFEWDRGAFSEVFHFGKWTFLSSSFSFALANGDRILLGAFLDPTTMGLYAIALVLMSTLASTVSRLVSQAVLPALSEVARERPAELRKTIYRVRLPLDVVCLGAAGALVFMGGPVVDLLYDDRYAEAGWMLGVLGLTLFSTRLDVFDQCLIALGRPKMLSALNAARLVALYAMVPAGYWLYGVQGAVGGVAGASLVNGLVVMTMQSRLGYLEIRRELLAVPIFAGGLAFGWLLKQAVFW